MRHVILFDSDLRAELLPLTLTRPVSELRLGILTLRQKWNHLFKEASFSHITSDELEALFPIQIQDVNTLINGSVIPSVKLKQLIEGLGTNEALMHKGELVAAVLPRAQFEHLVKADDLDDLTGYEVDAGEVTFASQIWDLCDLSAAQVAKDMELLNLSHNWTDNVMGDFTIFVHPTAKVERVTFNAIDGPIYIGREAILMDGAHMRGPLSIGDKSIIKMGANIYGGTSIGPGCIVGGEVKHSTILANSNKSHEGYLGDSFIGEWCNLGALTSNSNVKNTFSQVKVWHYPTRSFQETLQQKCGIFMGDYCRTAIHTRINAGTVIGVSCHLFGHHTFSGFVPSFSWGERDEYDISRAKEAATRMQALKGRIIETPVLDLLDRLHKDTAQERQLMYLANG